jgi:hypothetical protein
MVTARRGELEAALDMKGAAVAEAAAQWKKEVVWRRGVVWCARTGLVEARCRRSLRACVHARDSTTGGSSAERRSMRSSESRECRGSRG